MKRRNLAQRLQRAAWFDNSQGKEEQTMRSRFSFVALAAGILAAPAFAQNDAPNGQWDGVVVRNGARAPVSLRLSERNEMWRGRFEVDGASSPLDSVRVTGNRVHFEVPGQGAFDGTFSGDSMTGAVSGADRPGSFALTREKPTDLFPYSDPIESVGP